MEEMGSLTATSGIGRWLQVARSVLADLVVFAAGTAGGPGIAGIFASIGSVIRLVETGLGCALVPGSAVADRPGNFIAVPWLGAGRTVPIAMAWRRRRRQTPALDSFLATARSVLRRSDQPLTAVDMDDRP